MRILQILHGIEAGGIKTLAETIGTALERQGVGVDVVYLFPGVSAGSAAKIAGAVRTAWLVLNGGYDAILTYQSSASIIGAAMGWVARCPRRIVHQTAMPAEVKAPLRWLDRLAGTVGLYTANVINSGATWAAFKAYPAPYRRGMILIEHGVPRPEAARARDETLTRFAVPDDRSVLLNVGRLAAQKNQDVLIGALAALPTARLVVAGAGPLRARYEAEAAALGVADRLHLLGDVTREDVCDLLGAADAFVFPSAWETFGLAVVEAALAGLPIVAADLPVLREVLAGDDVAATFLPPRDVDAWVCAIRSCLDGRGKALPELTGRSLAERYSVPRMIGAYRALLTGTAGNAATAGSAASIAPTRTAPN